ncbi:acyltransferase family protein [Hellea balneolensis]|uniref:acyltransferase family protein n=1 Tax=Hellea balneolensis TaxID=287478 RepID=UPI00040DF364|nr:acyltransferase [Hellea balneolensis]
MVSTLPSGPVDPLFGANHFTPIRWVLAGLVALGHFWLTTTGYEPFRIHQWTGGYMAVNGFFVLSGLLIMKSLATRNDLKSYAVSRLLRIYPALIAIMIAFVFIFSTVFSKPGGLTNFTSLDTWSYALRVLFMGDPQWAPGGIFAGNLEEDFNGPLWTIRYEMAAYFLAAFAFFIGLAKRLWTTVLMFLVVQITYICAPLVVDVSVLPASIWPLFRLSSCFLLGMVLWHWPAGRRPPWWGIAIIAVLFAIFGAGFSGELLATLLLTGLMLRLGLSRRQFKPLHKLPDYSYGIYIWHYPIIQAILFLIPGLGPFEIMALSTPLFILFAGISWHMIEKPALKLKSRVS